MEALVIDTSVRNCSAFYRSGTDANLRTAAYAGGACVSGSKRLDAS
jgi:hypothetical protein